LTFSEAIFPGVKENYREAFIRRERRENREGKTRGNFREECSQSPHRKRVEKKKGKGKGIS